MANKVHVSVHISVHTWIKKVKTVSLFFNVMRKIPGEIPTTVPYVPMELTNSISLQVSDIFITHRKTTELYWNITVRNNTILYIGQYDNFKTSLVFNIHKT